MNPNTRHVFLHCGVDSGETRVERPGDASLQEMLEGFEQYLRATGYIVDGTLIIHNPNAEGRGLPASDE